MRNRFSLRFGNRQQQLDYLRQNGWRVVTYKRVPVVVAFHRLTDSGVVFVKGWQGKADKFSFYVHRNTLAEAETVTAAWVSRVEAAYQVKASRAAGQLAKRAALKASDHWNEGDVLYNSWGYDQTNIDWYQVVEMKPKSIVIRAVKKNYGEKQFLAGYSQPRRNEFCGEPILKPLSEDGRISFRHGAATKWDGKPVYESHYA